MSAGNGDQGPEHPLENPDAPLVIAGKFTMRELMNATAGMSRGGFAANGFGGFTAGWTVIGLVLGAPIPIVIPPALFAAALLSGYFSTPFTWFIASRRRDLVLGRAKWTFDGDGIGHETATTKAHHDWSVYRRARYLTEALVLEAGPAMGVAIPRTAIAEEDSPRLNRMLKDHGLLRPPSLMEQARPFLYLGIGALAAVAQFAFGVMI